MGVDAVILNLTRFGDLLQSQALIDDLHASGHKVGLVCLDNFATALPLLRHVDMAWRLPGAKLRVLADRNWAGAASLVMEFARDISVNGAPGHVLNLTPSLPARLLARLLANSGANMLGFGLDENGYGVNRGLWASFLAVAAGRRINSPFNVADLFRMLALPLTKRLAGSFLLAEPPADARDWAANFLAAQKPAASSGFVAFQPGASEDRRRWPVENFRHLGGRLWRESGYVPVLLGSSSEAHLGEKYAQEPDHPFINAIGQTSPVQLAALLRACRLIATNDTGTMHLAAGMGMPILSFFLATAQPWDTGPMFPGSCSLEPALDCHPCPFGKACANNEACRRQISADTAADLALARLLKGEWQAGISPRALGEARIWLTREDDAGMVVPMAAAGQNNGRSAWLACMRVFWRQLLDDMDNPDAPKKAALAAKYFEPGEFSLLQEIAAKAVPELEQMTAIMATLGELGKVAGKSPRAGKLLLLNCERAQTLLDNSRALGALAGFWRELRENMGADLADFLPAAAAVGRHCQSLAWALKSGSC